MRNSVKDIQLDLVVPDLAAVNKKKVFQILAKQAAPFCGLDERDLFERLMEQEKQSGSGIGDGVAIAHLTPENLERPFVAFVKLEKPVAFQALDDEPVDLVCLVLSPEKDGPLHLQRLSRITRLMRHKALRRNLRSAQSESAIRSVMTDSAEWVIAA